MTKRSISILGLLACLFASEGAAAFCGFYVAKADTSIFNRASQVVLVRDEDRTVLTMANDFKGDPKEFAVVIPVPTFIEREQINVGDMANVDHLDAYTAPRLVEYFDEDPCQRRIYEDGAVMRMEAMASAPSAGRLGVTIEASYTVGEYDILILSAEQSDGLETWLRENGYRIPDGATEVLGSYIKQEMRFFVAKVNLEEQAKLGFNKLRPLQVAYESARFMLPIRLGTVNADGPQELFIYVLTRTGRVETTNYRTVKLPTGMDIPVYVKGEFADFYRALFDTQTTQANRAVVFLEYAWDMNWCDPCAADPLSSKQLRELGVFWTEEQPEAQPRRPVPGRAANVFVTRLHVRYDAKSFPEDLVFQDTGDRANFQGRYVLRHAFEGQATCDEAEAYRKELPKRHETEAQTLATLTGWDISDIRAKMALGAPPSPEPAPEDPPKPWWQGLWGD